MTQGWQIRLFDKGQIRVFTVGIARLDIAIAQAVAKLSSKSSRITAFPLKDGEFEKLGMVDGQISELSQIG